jgi:AcrR family transcriptional regulator
MNDRLPSRLERLWKDDELDRGPRLGLSLERVVQSGVELADTDSLGAVSMKRVAERLGFTTMSVYRYVASKDELLLHMHDTVWQPPPGLDAPLHGWRAGLQRWTREQHLIMQRHPWLDEVRFIDRAGTPSQIAWIDLGLRALTGAPLTEYLKVAVLLLLSGYVSSQARLDSTAVDGTRQGLFGQPDQATEVIGELLRTVADAERFPALHTALVGGAFAPIEDPTYAPFELGLDMMLDGINQLMNRLVSESAAARAEPK